MRILIVEDDPQLLEHLRSSLCTQRYLVDTAVDGEVALDRIFDNPYDLILLDIMLPMVDGFGLLKEIREAGIKTPVLMLTAKGAVEDKIRGLDMGADDYLAKPFSMAELMARIRALFRRTGDNIDPALKVGSLLLNTITREVFIDNQSVELTPKEFSILEFLLYNKNHAVSRFSIAEHVWGDDFDPFTMSNFIDVHIKNLRKKIRDTDATLIRTIRGVGFIIKDTAE